MRLQASDAAWPKQGALVAVMGDRMVKLRNDFPFTALVMPEFMRAGSQLYALVPPEVHAARQKVAEALGVDQVLMESRMVDYWVRDPNDADPEYLPRTSDVIDKLGSILNPNQPSFGSDYPFFKPPIKVIRSLTKQILAPLESRFRFVEEVKGRNLQFVIEPRQLDAPYYYLFRYMNGTPRSPDSLIFKAIYHTWRDPILLSFVASDYREYWVFTEEDVPKMLQTGCDYINGIADFLNELDQSKA